MPLLPLYINIGVLIGFVSEYFLSYQEVTYVTFAIMFVFLSTYAIFPDTPKQLYKNLKRDECIKSMQIYCDTKSLEHKVEHFYWIEAKKIKNILKSERSAISDYGELNRFWIFEICFNNSLVSVTNESLQIFAKCISLLILQSLLVWYFNTSYTFNEYFTEMRYIFDETLTIFTAAVEVVGLFLFILFVNLIGIRVSVCIIFSLHQT